MIVLRSTLERVQEELEVARNGWSEATTKNRTALDHVGKLSGQLDIANTHAISLQGQVDKADERERELRAQIADLTSKLIQVVVDRTAPTPVAGLNALKATLQPDLTAEEIEERHAKRAMEMEWSKGFLSRMDSAWGAGMTYEEASKQPGFIHLTLPDEDEEETA